MDPVEEPPRRNPIDVVADRIDGFQRRVPPLAVAHGVLKKYGEDRGGHLATLLAYRGFFSLFPLLLAFVNALGLLLQNDPALRQRVIDSTLSNLPVVGPQLADTAQPLSGSVVVLVGSILAALWLGLHRLLCARRVPVRAQLPGAVAVGLGWWGLQAAGAWYVNRIVTGSSDTYGVFVVVFGLLSWSYLLAQVYLYGTELAVVLHDRRWPRSSSGRNLTDVDRAALAAAMEREARVRGTEISVSIPLTPGSTS